MPERIAAFPDRYAPGDLALRADVIFEPYSGSPVDVLSEPLIAGTRGTWVVRLVNEHADMPAGCALALIRFNYQFAYELQTRSPGGRDFCSVETSGDADLRLAPGRSSINLLTMHIVGGAFRTGDELVLRLGDQRQGSVGSEVFWSATEARLLVAADVDGSGQFAGIAQNPLDFRVVAHPDVSLVRLLAPTVVRVGDSFDLHLGVFDRNRNPIEGFRGEFALESPAALSGVPQRVTLSADDTGTMVLPGVCATQPGVHRIAVRGDACTFLSNPIVADEDPEQSVYWGDVHAHGWGDSTMYLMHLRTSKLDPIARHRQARVLGRHDFACPGAMSMDPEDREATWEPYREAWREMDQPGRFVPFLAYEAHPREGDRQVIFRGDEPVPPSMRLPMPELDARYGQRDDVLLEVHIGGAPPLWDRYRPQRERFLEICSGFGCAEWLLQRALGLGYRPALCGASDLHLGWLGGPRAVETFRGRFGQKYPMNQRDSAYGTGPLTAACAPVLTRDALWQAFQQRRTYATSGTRAYLALTCNGDARALSVDLAAPLRLALACHACAPVARIDLICGPWRLRSWQPQVLDYDIDLELSADELPGEWMYFRIEQTDGEWMWSPVVFLRHTGPVPSGDGLPAWNQDPLEEEQAAAGEAAAHVDDLRAYLEREEDPTLFHELTPVGVRDLYVGRCALFRCFWGDQRIPMSIRWFYEFEIPKIRYDFGWRDYGAVDELELGPRLMEASR